VCANLAPVSSSFYSVSTRRPLAGFVSRNYPVDLTFLVNSWMLVLGTVFPGNLRRNFLRQFLEELNFSCDCIENHAVEQYVEQYRHTII
jgi:hypothetical protein